MNDSEQYMATVDAVHAEWREFSAALQDEPLRDELRGVDGRGYKHDFAAGPCSHPDCGGMDSGGVSGWQCAECGHYFPRSRVRMDDDSETRCRTGMGHNA